MLGVNLLLEPVQCIVSALNKQILVDSTVLRILDMRAILDGIDWVLVLEMLVLLIRSPC